MDGSMKGIHHPLCLLPNAVLWFQPRGSDGSWVPNAYIFVKTPMLMRALQSQGNLVHAGLNKRRTG